MSSAELHDATIGDIKKACRNMFFTKETRNYAVDVMGPPGIGKTDLFLQLAHEWDADYRVFLTSTMDPTDVVGVPHERNGITHFCPPYDWIALTDQCHKVGVDPQRAIVAVLEDLPACAPQVFNSLLRVLCNGEVAGAKIRENVFLGATGNRVEDRAGAAQITSALANRFIHFSAKVDEDEWISWAISNEVDPFVTSFVKTNGVNKLHNFNPADGFVAFPTPRSVVMASNMIRAVGNKNESDLRLALSGCCGSGWAQDFITFYKIRSEIIPIEEIFKNPNKARVPKESQIDLLYVTVNNLIAATLSKYTSNKAKSLLIYCNRIPSEEIALFGLKKFFQAATHQNSKISVEEQAELGDQVSEWSDLTKELTRLI